MKLSETQTKVLNQMKPDKWYCSYDLSCSLGTLRALHQKGCVKMEAGLGSTFSPRVNITFQKINEEEI